jgi:hypothetical protein
VAEEINMNRILKLLMILTTSITLSAQTGDRHLRNGDERDVVKVQDALISAYIHRDTVTLDRILADEYTFINEDAGGVATKRQILDSFKSGGDRQITSYKRQDDKVRIYGDVAILTYRYQSEETYKGRYNGGDYRVTRILVSRDGQWQMVGGQETKVFDPEPGSGSVTSDDALTRLIGSWKQVSDEEVSLDGSVVRLDEVGFATYDASGHMSAQAMRRSATVQAPSDSIYVNNGYDAYFGTYTVDEASHTVTHHVEGSVARQLVGKDLVRSFAFDGNRLILKPTASGEHWTVTLEKIRSH